MARELAPPPTWRIASFFKDRPYQRFGVARCALCAALESICRRGGGIVEAYPASHGREVATGFCTTSMFEREGFAVARPFGPSNVSVRKEIQPRRALSASGRQASGPGLERAAP